VIIFRYLSRELLLNTLAVSSVLLLIFMSGRFVKYLAKAASGEMAADVLFTVIGYRVPGFLELVLPLGFFIGLLLALGRLYADSEMVVLSSCGVSQRQLLGMTLIPSLFIAVIVALMSFWVAPSGMRATELVLAEQRTRNDFDTVQPRRFQRLNREDLSIYVEGLSDNRKRLEGVFIAEGRASGGDDSRQSIILADYAVQGTHPEYQQRYLTLHRGYRYEGTPGQADFQVTRFEQYGQRMKPVNIRTGMRNKSDAWSTADLWEAEDAASRTTLQWRFSVPAMVIIGALLAFPLSRTDPRRGRYAKLLPALALFMFYYGVVSGVRGLMESGSWPVMPGLWAVHLPFALLALFLLFGPPWTWGRSRAQSEPKESKGA